MTADSPGNKIKDLQALQWANRIVLIFSEDPADDKLVEKLKANSEAVNERDIAWFVISKAAVLTNLDQPLAESFGDRMMKQYAENSDDLQVLLIGKDGGLKNRYSQLDLQEIYARIDSMPMRQAEMRR